MYKHNLTTFSRSSFFSSSWYNPPALFLAALHYFLHSVALTGTRNWWRVTFSSFQIFELLVHSFLGEQISRKRFFLFEFVISTIFRPDQKFLTKVPTFDISSNFVHLYPLPFSRLSFVIPILSIFHFPFSLNISLIRSMRYAGRTLMDA